MVNYKCDLCNKEFTKKCNYDQHLSRKTNCNKNINNNMNYIPQGTTKIPQRYHKDTTNIITNESNTRLNILINKNIKDDNKDDNKITCLKCNKIFSYKCHLYRHMKYYCKEKNNIINKIDIINENDIINDDKATKLEKKLLILLKDSNKKIDEYDKKINELEIKQKESELKLLDITNNNNIITKKRAYNKKSVKIINTNSNNNNTNITNNIININTIGCENLDKLNNKSIRAIQIADGKELFLKSISEINYNPNIPENHNICYKNLRSNDCYVYDDNKWITMDIKESVKFLLTSHIYHIKKLVLENKNIRMTKLSRDNIIL